MSPQVLLNDCIPDIMGLSWPDRSDLLLSNKHCLFCYACSTSTAHHRLAFTLGCQVLQLLYLHEACSCNGNTLGTSCTTHCKPQSTSPARPLTVPLTCH
jgi:hypothetical protein